MGCGASVEPAPAEIEATAEITEANSPIARPRGSDKVPQLAPGESFDTFVVVTPAGESINFGLYVTGAMIPVYSPDGQVLEVPCPKGYEGDGSSFPCRYVPAPDPSRPAPPYVGSGAGLHWETSGKVGGSQSAGGGRVPLRVCNDCGFGQKGMSCFKCGAMVPSHQRAVAPACRSCVFGSKAKECAKCGKYPNKFDAILCRSCAFGRESEECAKCGEYLGAFRG
jgi:hypothetical protein